MEAAARGEQQRNLSFLISNEYARSIFKDKKFEKVKRR
jgi:hypothetical protein